MSDEQTPTTPVDGTTVDEPTQPQLDPAAPDGTTVQDDPAGTTEEVKGEKEELYQTKYQAVMETLKEAGIDPAQLGTAQAGTIEKAFGDYPAQQQKQPGEPAPETEVEPDLYDQDQLKKYFDHNFGVIRQNLTDTVRGVVKEVRVEERKQLDFTDRQEKFNEWAAENKVPQPVIDAAVKHYYDYFGAAGSPEAFFDTVKRTIEDGSKVVQEEAVTTEKVEDAVAKAKALLAAEQPAQGAPNSPESKKELTPEQQDANLIAPDDDYKYQKES